MRVGLFKLDVADLAMNPMLRHENQPISQSAK